MPRGKKAVQGSVKSPKSAKVKRNSEDEEYTYILREYAPGKYHPYRVAKEQADVLKSLEIAKELTEDIPSATTLQELRTTTQHQIYITKRMASSLENFKQVVYDNWVDYCDPNSTINGDYFYDLMEKIENNPITHAEFTKWVREHRYLYESVFYQSLVYDLQSWAWKSLPDEEQQEYLSVYHSSVSYQDNFEKVVSAIESILDKYGIEY